MEEFNISNIKELGVEDIKLKKETTFKFWIGLGIVFTWGISMLACGLFILLSNFGEYNPDTFNAGQELFKTLSSVLSAPLGFVLGYYFRTD